MRMKSGGDDGIPDILDQQVMDILANKLSPENAVKAIPERQLPRYIIALNGFGEGGQLKADASRSEVVARLKEITNPDTRFSLDENTTSAESHYDANIAGKKPVSTLIAEVRKPTPSSGQEEIVTNRWLSRNDFLCDYTFKEPTPENIRILGAAVQKFVTAQNSHMIKGIPYPAMDLFKRL